MLSHSESVSECSARLDQRERQRDTRGWGPAAMRAQLSAWPQFDFARVEAHTAPWETAGTRGTGRFIVWPLENARRSVVA